MNLTDGRTSEADVANVTGIVLTGGRSSRMGEDKASLVLGGATLLARVVAALNALADEIVVVRAPGQSLPLVQTASTLTVVADRVEGAGPLEGIATGLEAITAPIALVVGVDHPFLRPTLLRLLLDEVQAGAPWVLPVFEGHPQPMCSAVAAASLGAIRTAISGGERSPATAARSLGAVLMDEARWRTADPEGLSFWDVDTPEAFEAAARHLEGSGR